MPAGTNRKVAASGIPLEKDVPDRTKLRHPRQRTISHSSSLAALENLRRRIAKDHYFHRLQEPTKFHYHQSTQQKISQMVGTTRPVQVRN